MCVDQREPWEKECIKYESINYISTKCMTFWIFNVTKPFLSVSPNLSF